MSAFRQMVRAAVACVLLTSLAGASDMIYDDLSPGDMGLMYQEHNYLEPGLGPWLPDVKEDSAMRGLMLYKLLTAVRDQDVAPNVLAGPNWISSGAELAPPETFEMPLRGPMMKRSAGVDTVSKVKPVPKPSQIEKKKKAKGSHMICYFKRCAFRPLN